MTNIQHETTKDNEFRAELRDETSGAVSQSHLGELKGLLTDERFDRSARLLRLQGWRGADLAKAAKSGAAHRLAPGLCAVLGFAVAATASVPLALVAMASAVVGIFAPNHPIETGYNWVAARSVLDPIPANRAGKRLGCVLGASFFGVAAISFGLGNTTLGTVMAIQMGVVATFVAASKVCVPSMIFTLIWGRDRASKSNLTWAFSGSQAKP